MADNKYRRWNMESALKRLWQEERGQDLVEYALLVALIALAATATMNTLGQDVNKMFSTMNSNLTANT